MEKKDLKNMVSVYGPGISGPLLQTNNARLIQIRDGEGKVQAMFFRITEMLWGFVARGDPDWEEHRRRLEIDDAAV